MRWMENLHVYWISSLGVGECVEEDLRFFKMWKSGCRIFFEMFNSVPFVGLCVFLSVSRGSVSILLMKHLLAESCRGIGFQKIVLVVGTIPYQENYAEYLYLV